MEGKSATLIEFSIQILSHVQLFLAACETSQTSILLWASSIFCLISQAKARQGTGFKALLAFQIRSHKRKG